MTLTRARRRAGFSLVELIAAMAVAVILMSLAAGLVYSGAFGSQRVIQSADKVATSLVMARQSALRNGLPYGLRLLASADGAITGAQFIESPEPWTPNPTGDSNGARLLFAYRRNTTTNVIDERKVFFADASFSDLTAIVGAGDLLLVPGLGSFRLNSAPGSPTSVTVGSGSVSAVQLDLATFPDLGAASATASNTAVQVVTTFSFLRQARPVLGENLIALPRTGAIDANRSGVLGTGAVPTITSDFDVLFAPNGRVLSQTGGVLAFWVRDVDRSNPTDFDNAGEQVLVVVYPKTGAVATQPVNPDNSTPDAPYSFTKDGINTGL